MQEAFTKQERGVYLFADAPCANADIAWAAANVLSRNALVPGDHSWIQVERGVVTPSGDIDWYFRHTATEHAVAGQTGVAGVTNALAIRPRTDKQDVAARTRAAIARQTTGEAHHVTVRVRDGAVRRIGTLRTLAEREWAFEATERQGGRQSD
ncbi:BON domain-containing protein [Cupriavidus sp. YR651]|uniref:BON domain-containing protein n=1 Tax=Cupriavidus sp. YR651 TaxID=1855315 RepID=UPI00087DFCCC|nr:BON domain-containing protein [Cupriavidus sp. YR651]SDD82179.1 BON domain-containing protein [Cupriavidus sp. YR651]